jgi:ABC-type transporter lipoprotein component MlaA
LLNNALQGNWKGAGHESERFFCNTVVGGGGFFDVASKWEIPKSDNDFGRTFSHWGWCPKFYLVLPIFGPSNDRDATGLLGDAAANPLTYFAPYTYATYGTGFNNLTGTVDDYALQSPGDGCYSVAQYGITRRSA